MAKCLFRNPTSQRFETFRHREFLLLFQKRFTASFRLPRRKNFKRSSRNLRSTTRLPINLFSCPTSRVSCPFSVNSHIMSKKIAVIGGGSWATAIVKMLCNNLSPEKSNIAWWIRSNETIDYIKKFKHNTNYLSSVELHLDQLELNSEI